MKIKRILTALIIVSLLAIPVSATGCSDSSTTNTYDYNDFTKLDIENAFDVDIVQSGTYGITVTSSKTLKDYLSVSKEGQTLIIKLHPNHPFTDFVMMRKVLKAKITLPVLNNLVISGACKVRVKGFESTDNLDIDVSGASNLTLNKIEAGNTKLIISGDSEISGKLTCVDLNVDISGASLISLDGQGEKMLLNATGATKINLEEFSNQTSDITLSGSSQATVNTREHLDVFLSGASRFFFLSNPSFGKTDVQGASTLKHKD
jgi:hypothetical protein